MAKTGRPPIGPEIKTRLPLEDVADLEERAAQLAVDRSEVIRRYVLQGLRDDARRYWEVSGDQAMLTLEVFRGASPDAEGEELAEWLGSHSLDDAAWAWLRAQGLDDSDPDVWVLVVPDGAGRRNRAAAVLPIGTHARVLGVCIVCGGPGPTEDFCDACAGSVTLLPPDTEE
jgi:hypothetical protein